MGILFIFYHIATLRWQWDFLVPGGAEWSHHFSASTLAAAMKGSTDTVTAGGFAVSLLYFVGVTMLVFHFANGLWTAAITWGLTISEQAQKRWGVVCAALGAGSWSPGGAPSGALALDHDTAKRVEIRLIMDNPEHLEIVKEKYGEGTGTSSSRHTCPTRTPTGPTSRKPPRTPTAETAGRALSDKKGSRSDRNPPATNRRRHRPPERQGARHMVRRVIVVGGGLAGLAAAVRVAEAGVPVDLFSMSP
jgi:succinate dehydrogenase/fumarate reductase cytochrome b subunit